MAPEYTCSCLCNETIKLRLAVGQTSESEIEVNYHFAYGFCGGFTASPLSSEVSVGDLLDVLCCPNELH